MEENRDNLKKSFYILPIAILIFGIIISGTFMIKPDSKIEWSKNETLTAEIVPDEAVLPVVWGDLGAKLVEAGIINEMKFRSLYEIRDEFSDEYEKLLLGSEDGNLKINKDNAGYLLNLFWALGLAQSNPVLTDGPMNDPQYGSPARFASTGGWTLASGDAMDHYSRHDFFDLSEDQQKLVEEVSKNIYRPCCGNSVHFPDCNHGMAMLGLLELMASQGATEEEMYDTAFLVNSFWFPGNYETVAEYLALEGIDWQKVPAKDLLGFTYSSAQGYQKIALEVQKRKGNVSGSVGSCGV